MSGGTRLTSFRGFNKTNINTAATTVVHTGETVLHSIVVNDTTAGAIRVYDDTACVNESLVATLGVKAAPTQGEILYDIKMDNGITVVTAADADLTVTFQKF